MGQAGWYILLIQALRRQTQAELCGDPGHSVLHSKFWDIWDYRGDPVANKQIETNNHLTASIFFLLKKEQEIIWQKEN